MIMQNLNVNFIHDVAIFIFSLPSHLWRNQYLQHSLPWMNWPVFVEYFHWIQSCFVVQNSMWRIWSCLHLWGVLQIVEGRRIRYWKKLGKNVKWFIMLSVLGALGDGGRHRVFKEREVNLDLGSSWIWICPRRLCWASSMAVVDTGLWTRQKLWEVGGAQLDRWSQDCQVVCNW